MTKLPVSNSTNIANLNNKSLFDIFTSISEIGNGSKIEPTIEERSKELPKLVQNTMKTDRPGVLIYLSLLFNFNTFL